MKLLTPTGKRSSTAMPLRHCRILNIPQAKRTERNYCLTYPKMSSKGATVVVFQGNKVFWRSKNTINVTIVDHRDTDRTEIICYEPTLETEAPRIYMDSVILATKLDQEYIGSKLLLAKQEKVPNSIKFVNDIVDRATAHYILDRLFQTEYNAETKAFKVKIQFSFNDRDLEPDDDSIDRLVCEKLERTTPYHVDHKKV